MPLISLRLRSRKLQQFWNEIRLTELEYLALLSDAAQPHIELIAQKARLLTRRHFGNIIFIFTPFYISNYCDSVCPYCSFSRQQRIERQHLSIGEVRAEAKRISDKGIRHVLGPYRRIAEYSDAGLLRNCGSSNARQFFVDRRGNLPYDGKKNTAELIERGVDG